VGDQQPGNHMPKLVFNTGLQTNEHGSTHCNFAGDDCWTIKTHPKIDQINFDQGMRSGGQMLKITGHGLDGSDIQVVTDDVPCEVQSSTNGEIVCLTGHKGAPSIAENQPGSPGLFFEKRYYGNYHWWYYDHFEPDADLDSEISTDFMTSFERVQGVLGDKESGRVSGWFTAPETGMYRFYITCDDACLLKMDTENPYVAGEDRQSLI
jgi:hypothetical protein